MLASAEARSASDRARERGPVGTSNCALVDMFAAGASALASGWSVVARPRQAGSFVARQRQARPLVARLNEVVLSACQVEAYGPASMAVCERKHHVHLNM